MKVNFLEVARPAVSKEFLSGTVLADMVSDLWITWNVRYSIRNQVISLWDQVMAMVNADWTELPVLVKIERLSNDWTAVSKKIAWANDEDEYEEEEFKNNEIVEVEWTLKVKVNVISVISSRETLVELESKVIDVLSSMWYNDIGSISKVLLNGEKSSFSAMVSSNDVISIELR